MRFMSRLESYAKLNNVHGEMPVVPKSAPPPNTAFETGTLQRAFFTQVLLY
ncbi:MAG: hypothetical protein ACI9BW_004312 [Gammaproteobacteria bacterium]|jgi:hypothetical protein